MKHPPILPTWFLKQFGCSPDNDAVLGDLAERYQHGETLIWYWKQTLIAIAVSTWEDVRQQKLLAFGAMFAALAVGFCTDYLASHLLQSLLYRMPVDWWNLPAFSIGFEVFTFLAVAFFEGIIGGWTTVRLYRRRRSILLFYILMMQVLATLAAVHAESIFWLVFYLATDMALIAGILAGGRLAAAPKS